MSSASGCRASSSNRPDRNLTRSMTRPIRVAVEKINAPHAEMSTAGVIIAVSTANALAGASSRVSQSTALFYSRRRREVPSGLGLKFKTELRAGSCARALESSS